MTGGVRCLLPPALRATPLINAGGKVFPIRVNNNLPFLQFPISYAILKLPNYGGFYENLIAHLLRALRQYAH